MITSAEIENNKEEIIRLLQSTKREGIENIIKYLNESGFFYVPSSRHRHHNWKGGLAQHSLGVYTKACKNTTDINRDSLIIAALLHDICKAGMLYYDSEGNLHHREVHIHGHGYRSVKLLERFGLKLTTDERLAIRWHMHSRHAQPDDSEDLINARTSALWQTVHMADKEDAKERHAILS